MTYLKYTTYFSLLLLIACTQTHEAPETPGNLPNPKLATLVNKAFEEETYKLKSNHSGPQVLESQRDWRLSFKEIVAHCKYGASDNTKGNYYVFDVELKNGKKRENIYSGKRCQYGADLPLVMKVTFENGIATNAFTDGRELKNPINFVNEPLKLLASEVSREDRNIHYESFKQGLSQEKIKAQWKN